MCIDFLVNQLRNLRAYRNCDVVVPKGLIIKIKLILFSNTVNTSNKENWRQAHHDLSIKLMELSLEECQSQINSISKQLDSLTKIIHTKVSPNNLSILKDKIKSKI